MTTAKDTLKRSAVWLFTQLQRFPAASRMFDSICLRYHKVHINFNYDHETNGERWVLERLAQENRLRFVLDVGANRGDWTALALTINPQLQAHCFEICPPTFEKLRASLGGNPQVALQPVGLSDAAGEITIQYCPDGDGLSSLIEVVCSMNTQSVKARVTTGIEYCRSHNITKIDFLKLDVEGAEHLVLAGFEDMINPENVPVVQFEYGMVNIVSKYLLRDFYGFFTSRGYRVGKLFPSEIRFREYRLTDEDFLGPNFIAASPQVASLLEK